MIQTRPSVTLHSFDCGPVPAEVSISRFQGASGVEEYHLVVRPTQCGDLAAQLEWLTSAYHAALGSLAIGSATCILRRFFCSDLTNQADVLKAHRIAGPDEPCAISCVCQPPAPPARLALWAYHVNDPSGALDRSKSGATLTLNRGELSHLWTTGATHAEKHTPYDQTEAILESHEDSLNACGICLADNVIRTWFFVRDIDANYKGLVDARRDVFARRGLTPDTHFIASTGVGGASADTAATVSMDAYAISGVRADQIQFLSAPDHLSPTYIYGVTFERGVSVSYRDRRHVVISGTASIDSEGRIVHPGDVSRQLDHALDNVEALLTEAGAAFADVCSFIVYVRDASDLDLARRVMRERFGEAPCQVVVAPVCRPGWLIEVECQAIVPAENPALPAF
jgi:enamine deaminase RidA (YjgF/YER057c/UK114 family)